MDDTHSLKSEELNKSAILMQDEKKEQKSTEPVTF
jgi:hypothetical protein